MIKNLTIVISRLLDMPIETEYSCSNNYCVRVHTGSSDEQRCTQEIEGPPPDTAVVRNKETVNVHPEVGTLKMLTSSPRLYFQVELCNATGNTILGEMKILLKDPRTKTVTQYQLSQRSRYSGSEVHAGCGIELKIIDNSESESEPSLVNAATRQQYGFPIGTETEEPVGGGASIPPPSSQVQAAVNAEVQNRALIQQCKIANSAFVSGDETSSHVHIVNGYREWDSLDNLFKTMGPNPMSMTERVGPSVIRSYIENVSAYDEFASKNNQAAASPEELRNIMRNMYGIDPDEVEPAVRPVVCKDPTEIESKEDMDWCNPPTYTPFRSMSNVDNETLRLACFDSTQCAKINFVDANPTYRIEEDVWGLVADQRRAVERAEPNYIPKKYGQSDRVKDECFIT